jgi:transcriptional regulator of PTS gene
MRAKTGSNIQDIKSNNRMLVLKHIATNSCISRVDIARITGLSKMTVGNIVIELTQAHLVEETDTAALTANYGRKPIMLTLASDSPCICGILIKRKLCQIILSNLGGKIFFQKDYPYDSLDSSDHLLDIISSLFEECRTCTSRRIMAIGISSVGPLDSKNGIILKPPYFYGIENVPIVSIIQAKTHIPTFLVNDATAGAFAEKLFGQGVGISNFAYLHIMNGIGAGFILNHMLYNGDSGQSGEIGHTSINFDGPRCVCGNKGCLDLYANVDNMRSRIVELAPFFPASDLSGHVPSWSEIVTAGNHGDMLAISVLEEFCSYIAYSLTNTVNLLNLSTIIVGYDSKEDGTIIEKLLQHKLSTMALSAKYRSFDILHSSFGGNAPLIGSVALVANKVFEYQLSLSELE